MSPRDSDYVEALRKSANAENKKVIIVLISFILSSFFIVAGWNGQLKPDIDDPSIWFQRSGSVVVLSSLFVDFFISREKTRMSNQFPNKWQGDFFEVFEKYLPIFKILHIISIIFAVVGTIIWGYGDLIFDLLK